MFAQYPYGTGTQFPQHLAHAPVYQASQQTQLNRQQLPSQYHPKQSAIQHAGSAILQSQLNTAQPPPVPSHVQPPFTTSSQVPRTARSFLEPADRVVRRMQYQKMSHPTPAELDARPEPQEMDVDSPRSSSHSTKVRAVPSKPVIVKPKPEPGTEASPSRFPARSLVSEPPGKGRGGRAKNSRLSEESRQKSHKMRKLAACWRCALQRDPVSKSSRCTSEYEH